MESKRKLVFGRKVTMQDAQKSIKQENPGQNQYSGQKTKRHGQTTDDSTIAPPVNGHIPGQSPPQAGNGYHDKTAGDQGRDRLITADAVLGQKG